MKKLALFSLLAVSAALLNTGCAASGSIKPTSSTAKPSTAVQIAYTTAPAQTADCPLCPACPAR